MFKYLSLLLLLLVSTGRGSAQENHNFETSKALDIFNALYRDLDLYYVDTLSAEKNVGNAIEYMLSQLDPYTEFYKESETDELRTMATGKYAGIGSPIRYHKGSDRCIFDKPYLNMPAYKAGVRTGDIILKINGKDVGERGKRPVREYTEGITSQLRGDANTSFTLTVRRPGQSRPLDLRLTRTIIKTPVVPYHTLLPNAVGYVRLSTYNESTTTEFRQALLDLKARGAQKLVFDLRGNGGGLMSEAVNVVNLFVPKGKLVLETKAKEPELNQRLKTTAAPLDEDIPMAVLVDYSTASAAEITSGNFQDYDRAVIVGQRTYGKGLVQSTRSLPYETAIKLTTAKYYIPSGRCVQAYDFKRRGKEGQPMHLPDSLCKPFKTLHGRTVKDGGGISPDIEVKLDTLPNLLTYLALSDELFDYCVDYDHRHKHIASPAEFSLTDEEFEHFKQYMAASKFTYDNQTKKALEQVRKLAALEGYSTTAKAELDALEAKLSHNLSDDLTLWKKEVKQLIEAEIISNRYGQRGYLEYELREDKTLQAGLDILADEARYKKILQP